MRTIHKSKNPIPYDEDWAEGFVTHVGLGGGGGRNNYTGAKKVPTRRILDARKKLIDKIYLLHDQLVALDSSLVKDMITGKVLNPIEWRDPPQYMDRDELKHYVKRMKADVKSEKQKLKKSHKFSSGKKRVGKRDRGKYHKRDKKDKSRRRKKKTRFSAGNKIPATHEADKKLSKAEIWKKHSLECFGEKEKAKRKVAKLEKELRKCSRNLTKCSRNLRLSQELLKANEKSRKHKFRNGDGKLTITKCWERFAPRGGNIPREYDEAHRECLRKVRILDQLTRYGGFPTGETSHQRGDAPGGDSER